MYIKCVNKNYSFRFRLPKDVQPYFDNRTEIIISLKTKNKLIATVKSRELAIKVKNIIAQIKYMFSINFVGIDAVVTQLIDNNVSMLHKSKKSNDRLTYYNAVVTYLKYFEYKTESKSQYDAVSSFMLSSFLAIMGKNNSLPTSLDDCLERLQELALLPKMSSLKIKIGWTKERLLESNNKISKTTYSKYIKWVRAFYVWAYNNGHIKVNIAQTIKRTPTDSAMSQRSLLTDNEINKLFEIAKSESNDLYTMIKILAYSGIRHSEFFKMKVKQDYFDLTDKSTTLKTASSYRIVPRHQELCEIDNGYIVYLQNKYNNRDLTKMGMKVLRLVTTDKTKVLYSLRHSVATKLQNELVAPSIISQILGHLKDTSITTSRYAKGYQLEILSDAVERIKY